MTDKLACIFLFSSYGNGKVSLCHGHCSGLWEVWAEKQKLPEFPKLEWQVIREVTSADICVQGNGIHRKTLKDSLVSGQVGSCRIPTLTQQSMTVAMR